MSRPRASKQGATPLKCEEPDWDAIKHDVKPIYTAVNAAAARAALDELTQKWGTKYAAIIRLWNNAWEEFIAVP